MSLFSAQANQGVRIINEKFNLCRLCVLAVIDVKFDSSLNGTKEFCLLHGYTIISQNG